jgi:hypothetical protein
VVSLLPPRTRSVHCDICCILHLIIDFEQEGEYQPTEEDGKLKVEVAQKMLKWHAESIGRCVELSAPGDLPKNVFALMRTLSEAIGRGYVETALES